MHNLKKTIPIEIALSLIVFLILVCGFFISKSFSANKKIAEEEARLAAIPPVKVNYFAVNNIEAKAAIVYDVKTRKIIYAKNAAAKLPLASLTKIMTALVANDAIPKDETISIDSDSLAIEGENGFTENQPWLFSDLLNFTLLASSNDGAHAIANTVTAAEGIKFTSKMDQKASELGLSSMNFNNENGLDIEDTSDSGGYGSAQDVAKLFTYILTKRPGLLEITKNDSWSFKALDNTLYKADNTDIVVNKIPGILASKTGYTDLAGGNLAVALDAGLNHPIVIVVLGSSLDGRFNDVLALASSTLKSL